MKVFAKKITIGTLAQEFKLDHTLSNKALDTKLSNVAELEQAKKTSLCFCESDKYLNAMLSCKAVAIITTSAIAQRVDKPLLISENPYLSFTKIVEYWQRVSKDLPTPSISKKAEIDSSAKIGKGCFIGANSYVGKDVEIGDNCTIYPNVSILKDSKLGDNVTIHSGVVVGSDGFGFILHQSVQNKIPQVGNVVIQDNVEVGANSCIDRATIGSTLIGQGSKLDNLVQVGHNVKIGKNCCICAQVGLAGNTVIGDYNYIGGQAGFAGHIKLGDFVKVGAQAGVSKGARDNEVLWGTPATEMTMQKKMLLALRKLPTIIKKLKKKGII